MTGPVVKIRAETPGIMLRLRDPCRPFHDEYGYSDRFLDFTLDLHSDGLRASLPVRTYDGDQLPEFLHQLAEDFHGWDGQRTWESCEHDLRLDARHLSRGIVELAWTVRQPRYVPGEREPHWSVTVTIYVEAGEQMRHLAQDVATFLSVERLPPEMP